MEQKLKVITIKKQNNLEFFQFVKNCLKEMHEKGLIGYAPTYKFEDEEKVLEIPEHVFELMHCMYEKGFDGFIKKARKKKRKLKHNAN